MAYSNERKIEIISILVNRMANEGKSVAAILKEEKNFPGHDTILEWCKKDENISKDYARGKAGRADDYFEKILAICETVLKGEQNPHAARVVIDSYKWILARMDYKRFGERMKIDQEINERKNVADLFPPMEDEESEE